MIIPTNSYLNYNSNMGFKTLTTVIPQSKRNHIIRRTMFYHKLLIINNNPVIKVIFHFTILLFLNIFLFKSNNIVFCQDENIPNEDNDPFWYITIVIDTLLSVEEKIAQFVCPLPNDSILDTSSASSFESSDGEKEPSDSSFVEAQDTFNYFSQDDLRNHLVRFNEILQSATTDLDTMIPCVKEIQEIIPQELWDRTPADLNKENNFINKYLEALKIQVDPNNGDECTAYIYIFAACTTHNTANVCDLNIIENTVLLQKLFTHSIQEQVK